MAFDKAAFDGIAGKREGGRNRVQAWVLARIAVRCPSRLEWKIQED